MGGTGDETAGGRGAGGQWHQDGVHVAVGLCNQRPGEGQEFSYSAQFWEREPAS